MIPGVINRAGILCWFLCVTKIQGRAVQTSGVVFSRISVYLRESYTGPFIQVTRKKKLKFQQIRILEIDPDKQTGSVYPDTRITRRIPIPKAEN